MLSKRLYWLGTAEDLKDEMLESRDEGKDVSAFEERVSEILGMDQNDPKREKLAGELYDELAKLPIANNFKYIEPSDLPAIKEARPEYGKNIEPGITGLNKENMYDKIYGAWLGRCSGCLFGQPFEGWYRDRIVGLLKDTGNYPVKYYVSSELPEEIKIRYSIVDAGQVYGGNTINWINNVKYMPEDDDINYTLIGLKVLEKYGYGFTNEDIAETWLTSLPILHVCTAERVAYKNFVNKIIPPASAVYRNPFREWIGAQIRADIFGYVTPGDPELAAELSWRDASISHTRNGIYSEIFIAAMISAAFIKNDVEEIIITGISQIPERSRLHEAIKAIIEWKKEGITCENAIERVHEKYNEQSFYDWCHTIPNAMIVCIGLLFGELDFQKSIGITVSAGFDTDCNGATVGSIMGMLLGAKVLPEKWVKPLNNKLVSGVDGYGFVSISDMAERTLKIFEKKVGGD